MACERTVRLVVPCCHQAGYRFNKDLHLRFNPKSGDVYLAPKRRERVPGHDEICGRCGRGFRLINITNVDSEDPADWIEQGEVVTMVNPDWPAHDPDWGNDG